MRIWRVTSILLLSLVAVVGFSKTPIKREPVNTAHIPTPQTFTRHQILKSFNRIDVSGAMHVLVGQLKVLKNSVATVHTDKQHPVTLTVKNHTLYISTMDQPHQFMPFVHLRIKHLNWLTVNGHASVVVRHTSSENLHVIANDFADVSLMGLVNVKQIQQNDQSKVNVQWVDSKSLTVNVNGDSKLTLVGATNKLIATASDKAQVKAEYLRAGTAWAKAEGQSSIFITPVKSLSAFANNRANVYYYKYPEQLNMNTTQSGNVLQMAWHN